mmetsp:Transcript_25410/g.59120  ORF Transcript_25410/g.59120 Transcript_25410/m.59120 type:complete len:482 (-) Transcript_25410:58-1503(-)
MTIIYGRVPLKSAEQNRRQQRARRGVQLNCRNPVFAACPTPKPVKRNIVPSAGLTQVVDGRAPLFNTECGEIAALLAAAASAKQSEAFSSKTQQKGGSSGSTHVVPPPAAGSARGSRQPTNGKKSKRDQAATRASSVSAIAATAEGLGGQDAAWAQHGERLQAFMDSCNCKLGVDRTFVTIVGDAPAGVAPGSAQVRSASAPPRIVASEHLPAASPVVTDGGADADEEESGTPEAAVAATPEAGAANETSAPQSEPEAPRPAPHIVAMTEPALLQWLIQNVAMANSRIVALEQRVGDLEDENRRLREAQVLGPAAAEGADEVAMPEPPSLGSERPAAENVTELSTDHVEAEAEDKETEDQTDPSPTLAPEAESEVAVTATSSDDTAGILQEDIILPSAAPSTYASAAPPAPKSQPKTCKGHVSNRKPKKATNASSPAAPAKASANLSYLESLFGGEATGEITTALRSLTTGNKGSKATLGK